ncbi:hypothetical protein GF380_00980 [Candidatus Uhrbacteria bacterium]|nr:hypothetical protein [Candidatus Uhrbacteria bacterium]
MKYKVVYQIAEKVEKITVQAVGYKFIDGAAHFIREGLNENTFIKYPLAIFPILPETIEYKICVDSDEAEETITKLSDKVEHLMESANFIKKTIGDA